MAGALAAPDLTAGAIASTGPPELTPAQLPDLTTAGDVVAAAAAERRMYYA